MSHAVVEPEVAISLPPRLARQFRRVADLTQADLASAAQIPYPRFVAFELGRLKLTAGELDRVRAALRPRLLDVLTALEAFAQPPRGEDEGAAHDRGALHDGVQHG